MLFIYPVFYYWELDIKLFVAITIHNDTRFKNVLVFLNTQTSEHF